MCWFLLDQEDNIARSSLQVSSFWLHGSPILHWLDLSARTTVERGPYQNVNILYVHSVCEHITSEWSATKHIIVIAIPSNSNCSQQYPQIYHVLQANFKHGLQSQSCSAIELQQGFLQMFHLFLVGHVYSICHWCPVYSAPHCTKLQQPIYTSQNELYILLIFSNQRHHWVWSWVGFERTTFWSLGKHLSYLA